MGTPQGFEWTRRKNGDVEIRHNGRNATTLRGPKAADFIQDTAEGDDQELMARLTGNYRRGNERESRNHPRNRRKNR